MRPVFWQLLHYKIALGIFKEFKVRKVWKESQNCIFVRQISNFKKSIVVIIIVKAILSVMISFLMTLLFTFSSKYSVVSRNESSNLFVDTIVYIILLDSFLYSVMKFFLLVNINLTYFVSYVCAMDLKFAGFAGLTHI